MLYKINDCKWLEISKKFVGYLMFVDLCYDIWRYNFNLIWFIYEYFNIYFFLKLYI